MAASSDKRSSTVNGGAGRPRRVLVGTYGEPQPPALEAPDRPIVVIVHVTDLHLHLNDSGPMDRWEILKDGLLHGPRATAQAVVCAVQSVAMGDAWHQLVRLLGEITRHAHGYAVVVAQTGDVEAFGAGADGGYAGYADLHGRVWPQLEANGAVCVDVYGNHDIWPSVFLTPHFQSRHQMGPEHLAQRFPRLGGDWNPVALYGGGIASVRIHRVDTIDPHPVTGGVLAQGRIRAEPGSTSSSGVAGVVERLRRDTEEPSAIQVLLSHHPLYEQPEFAHTVRKGRVRHVDQLALVLSSGILVVSGHMHKLRPALGTKGEVPQLVSQSPTAVSLKSTWGDGCNSVSLYAISPREPRTSPRGPVEVTRFRIEYSRSRGFAPDLLQPVEPDIVPCGKRWVIT